MLKQIKKPNSDRVNTAACAGIQKSSDGSPALAFVANRAAANAEKHLQHLANNSAQIHQFKTLQNSANNRLKIAPAAQFQPLKTGSGNMGPVVQKVDLTVRYSQTPHIHGHIEGAIENGNPSTLTKNSARATQNRSDAAKSFFGTDAPYNSVTGLYSFPSAGSGMSWDEYPFASTEEGGTDCSLEKVPVGEQHIQGGQLSHIPAGKFNVVLDDN